ncbi:MAG TPA: hypothetical protein VD999_05165 [Vitreimonas sp.]|nr:hypothetical protein [Vitreimonas sp.]
MAQTTQAGLTLTDLTYFGRQFVKYGIITVVVLIVGRTLLTAFIAFWKATHPAPPPPPTVGFGILPAIKFPAQTSDDKPGAYVLETATGTTPDFGDRAPVLFMPKSAASLLADQRARSIATAFEFGSEPEVLDSRTYRWTKSQPLEYVLEMDIQNYHFELTSDYLTRPELITDLNLPDNFEAVEMVKGYLTNVDLLPEDMATAAGEVTYLKSIGGQLQQAVSFSDADFIQVDLNRTPVEDAYRMYSPEGYKGTAHAVLAGTSNGQGAIVHFEYHYNPADNSEVHTYPIRTSQSAWKLLQSGEGFIVNKGAGTRAVIRDVALGYFDSFEEQDYLQPVYVFSGDDGFLAYVPAIDPEFIQTGQ